MSVEAVRSEALSESQTVTWRDKKFTIAPPETWMMDFLHYWERDRPTLAVEQMLGPEQYEEFRAAKPKPADLEALVETIHSAYGMTSGE